MPLMLPKKRRRKPQLYRHTHNLRSKSLFGYVVIEGIEIRDLGGTQRRFPQTLALHDALIAKQVARRVTPVTIVPRSVPET